MAETVRLGGMALQNGVLVHGPTSWGLAVREEDGSLRVASGKKPRFAGLGVDPVHPRPASVGRGIRRPAGRTPVAPAGPHSLRPPRRARCARRDRGRRQGPPALGRALEEWARARGSRPRAPSGRRRAARARARSSTPAPSTCRSGRTRTAGSPRRRSTRAAARSSSGRSSRPPSPPTPRLPRFRGRHGESPDCSGRRWRWARRSRCSHG